MHLPFIDNDEDTDNGNGNGLGLGLEGPRHGSEWQKILFGGGCIIEIISYGVYPVPPCSLTPVLLHGS